MSRLKSTSSKGGSRATDKPAAPRFCSKFGKNECSSSTCRFEHVCKFCREKTNRRFTHTVADCKRKKSDSKQSTSSAGNEDSIRRFFDPPPHKICFETIPLHVTDGVPAASPPLCQGGGAAHVTDNVSATMFPSDRGNSDTIAPEYLRSGRVRDVCLDSLTVNSSFVTTPSIRDRAPLVITCDTIPSIQGRADTHVSDIDFLNPSLSTRHCDDSASVCFDTFSSSRARAVTHVTDNASFETIPSYLIMG
ncbi:hypothetical protein Bbelb_364040 [Branchiostoma belcheri]|nr:hypothetical protein Bbelb_364040 [Branchiostoma belcheri]